MILTKSKIKTFNKNKFLKQNGKGMFSGLANSVKMKGCATFKQKLIGDSKVTDYGVQAQISSDKDQTSFLNKVDEFLVELYVIYALMFHVLTEYNFSDGIEGLKKKKESND